MTYDFQRAVADFREAAEIFATLSRQLAKLERAETSEEKRRQAMILRRSSAAIRVAIDRLSGFATLTDELTSELEG